MLSARNLDITYSLQLSSGAPSLAMGDMAAASSLVNKSILPTLQKVSYQFPS